MEWKPPVTAEISQFRIFNFVFLIFWFPAVVKCRVPLSSAAVDTAVLNYVEYLDKFDKSSEKRPCWWFHVSFVGINVT